MGEELQQGDSEMQVVVCSPTVQKTRAGASIALKSTARSLPRRRKGGRLSFLEPTKMLLKRVARSASPGSPPCITKPMQMAPQRRSHPCRKVRAPTAKRPAWPGSMPLSWPIKKRQRNTCAKLCPRRRRATLTRWRNQFTFRKRVALKEEKKLKNCCPSK